jgi:glycosyltransferase involved in cell wall biosynthesis
MHVALVAPLVSAIRDDRPPLGGVEIFLLDLIRGLRPTDVRVTLLAADGSSVQGADVPSLGIDARRLALASFSADTERRDLPAQAEAFESVRRWCQQHAADLDVVHGHAFDAPAFDALSQLRGPAIVHTLHLPPVQSGVVRSARLAAEAGARLVAVSHTSAEAWRAAGVPIVQAIPNGLDVDGVPFGAVSDGYLLFAGRLSPEKGPDLAIAAAHRLDRPLLVVGNVYDPVYYAEALRPRLNARLDWAVGQPLPPGATYIGHRQRAEVLRLMAGASATLMPVQWDEPFGLVALEAQAAGSPVVGFDRGALREVVHHGQTGLLVPADAGVPGLAEAITHARSLERAACRAWVEQRYSIGAMLDAYLSLYAR